MHPSDNGLYLNCSWCSVHKSLSSRRTKYNPHTISYIRSHIHGLYNYIDNSQSNQLHHFKLIALCLGDQSFTSETVWLISHPTNHDPLFIRCTKNHCLRILTIIGILELNIQWSVNPWSNELKIIGIGWKVKTMILFPRIPFFTHGDGARECSCYARDGNEPWKLKDKRKECRDGYGRKCV